jgi:hypothetical protein
VRQVVAKRRDNRSRVSQQQKDTVGYETSRQTVSPVSQCLRHPTAVGARHIWRGAMRSGHGQRISEVASCFKSQKASPPQRAGRSILRKPSRVLTRPRTARILAQTALRRAVAGLHI